MKKSEVIRVNIKHLAPDGSGFAEADGRTMLVKGVLPGDEANIRVLSIKRHSARVKLESIISEGVKRTVAKCPHFSLCGGCRWQNVPYDIQCRLKTELIKEILGKVSGIEPIEHIDIIPSPDMFYYRNKMEFSFDKPLNTEKLLLGLHEFGRYDRVLDITGCLLQSELSNRVIDFTRNFAIEHKLSAYGLKSHTGLLRFLMVRDGKNTGDLMVNLVTSDEEFDKKREFCDCIVNEIPEVTTVTRSINSRSGSTSMGEEREVLFGDGSITDRIGKFVFTISPDSFFQTNTHQTKNLYDTILEFCCLSGTEHILDLYCGTGTIGIYLAEMAKEVTGVEIIDEAVTDAKRNAEINGINNITFITGKAEKTLDESPGKFDVVICDPPRAGLHHGVMNYLVRVRIRRMVYVSCNVKTMPGDMETLLMAGYRVKKIRVFDMSPHTPHVETVLLLEIE